MFWGIYDVWVAHKAAAHEQHIRQLQHAASWVQQQGTLFSTLALACSTARSQPMHHLLHINLYQYKYLPAAAAPVIRSSTSKQRCSCRQRPAKTM